MFDGRKYRWDGTTALWANATTQSSTTTNSFIEFVTSPNNPDTSLQKPVLGGAAAAIVDHAYYWPHFTHIPAPADEDAMLFTMSKLSGHAGSRFGYVHWLRQLFKISLHIQVHILTSMSLDCTGGR
jgi:histidinol-phosphate/aromatic aminotransferase/cobyric acid decarboxylase-like protein